MPCRCGIRYPTSTYCRLFGSYYRKPSKPLVTLCQVRIIRGHRVKEGKVLNFGLGWLDRYVLLGQVFAKKVNNGPKHFLNSLNRTQFENGKIAEILESSVKSGLLLHSTWQN